MKTLIKIFLILLIGVAFGYSWSFFAYQPLKLAEDNRELKVDVKVGNSAWIKEFSKKHKLIEE